MLRPLTFAAVVALLCAQANAEPVRVLDTNFPDPCVIKADGGYYAFGTTSEGVNTQVARSDDFATWELLSETDALPGPFPDWVASEPNVWAPDVIQLDDGTFVMYFSASISADTSKHCVGAATSSSITGPYAPEASPFACPLDQGGAIDADGYEDDDGTLYATYKIDGNSLNSDGSFHPTPIMLQKLKSDGITRDGDAVKILERGAADGPVIEAPSLVKSNGTYFLSFSSGMYNTPQYDVAYATAPSITGPYTKAAERLLETGDPSNVGLLAGPGGSDFKGDGTVMAFHAFRNGQNISDGRAMYTTGIRLSGDTISIEGYSSLPLPGAAVPPQKTANQAARHVHVPFM